MLLSTELSEYLDFTIRSGFVLTIHGSDVYGFPMDLGIFVPNGYVSSTQVTVVKLAARKCRVTLPNYVPAIISAIHEQVATSIQ